jgi:GTP pyrophosphokinase
MDNLIDLGDPTLLEGWQADLPSVGADLLAQVAAWVKDRYEPAKTPADEPLVHHCAQVALILAQMHTDSATRATALLLALPEAMGRGADPVGQVFGADLSRLVSGTRALLKLGDLAREATGANASADRAERDSQKEMLRKMLLAMAADLRIVLVRLASRLQTLRWLVKQKTESAPSFARETLDLYAPLANRLGIWQIKWEMEDLAFRLLDPMQYRDIAKKLEEKRAERSLFIDQTMAQLEGLTKQAGISAVITGRPKHIYSIWNKMQKKDIDFDHLYDLRALRVIVADEKQCYSVLGLVHAHWTPVGDEFDDYISRPKPNGYRSLHTVVADQDGRAFEVQIRTQAMHDFAEHGLAAHWRYKESGAPANQAATAGAYDRQLAWMRQLLAWQSDAGSDQGQMSNLQTESDHIYVLSPQARVIELPQHATPVDFAYHLHTDLGHRCRGAKVDGHLVPLHTRLQTGQTVEVLSTKAGGPSRDWLNPQLGFLASPRARAKVRAWFNAIELQQRMTQGQALVEKELQRLGKTAINLEQLAQQLGFAHADDLYVAVSKEEFSLRHVDAVFHPRADDSPLDPSAAMLERQPHREVQSSAGVLVQGVGSLMTQLARCCRPAPPDPIGGFITRGRGVSVHRSDCSSFLQLQRRHLERVIEVSWGDTTNNLYPVDVVVRAQDREGLLRDLSEVFARLRLNVVAVNTQSKGSLAHMVFTVKVSDGASLQRANKALSSVDGVISVLRR